MKSRKGEGLPLHGAAVFDCGKLNRAGRGNCASMGPQSFDCGKSLCAAMRRTDRASRFNGGAVFRLRKATRILRLPLAVAVLQWGRSLSTAERSAILLPDRRIDQPKSFNGAAVFRLRKADSSRLRSDTREASCFNGAAVFRLRKEMLISLASSSNDAGVSVRASMGRSLSTRGKSRPWRRSAAQLDCRNSGHRGRSLSGLRKAQPLESHCRDALWHT